MPSKSDWPSVSNVNISCLIDSFIFHPSSRDLLNGQSRNPPDWTRRSILGLVAAEYPSDIFYPLARPSKAHSQSIWPPPDSRDLFSSSVETSNEAIAESRLERIIWPKTSRSSDCRLELATIATLESPSSHLRNSAPLFPVLSEPNSLAACALCRPPGE